MTLMSEVKDQLEQRIVEGIIAAGERVNENAIATELNVSRSVVREAVRSLEQVGLVQVVEGRGALVRSPTLSDILELYDIRAGLSAVAARLVTQRATKHQIDSLEDLHTRMEEARDQEDVAAYDALNIQFHSLFFDFANNARLKQMHASLSKEVRLFVRHGVAGRAGLRVSSREHADILRGVRDGDPEAAAVAFTQHVLHGRARMLENLSLTTA